MLIFLENLIQGSAGEEWAGWCTKNVSNHNEKFQIVHNLYFHLLTLIMKGEKGVIIMFQLQLGKHLDISKDEVFPATGLAIFHISHSPFYGFLLYLVGSGTS